MSILYQETVDFISGLRPGSYASPTARKDLPAADVAAAGGWTDVGTLLRCYQRPDAATMLKVMCHPRKVVEIVKAG